MTYQRQKPDPSGANEVFLSRTFRKPWCPEEPHRCPGAGEWGHAVPVAPHLPPPGCSPAMSQLPYHVGTDFTGAASGSMGTPHLVPIIKNLPLRTIRHLSGSSQRH